MNKLKYTHYDITFQEVPNEVSLVINISGCPHHCEGCHSQYLWDYVGDYIIDSIDEIIQKYNSLITCVCFMGGDQNLDELKILLHRIKNKYQLKTCLYSGSDDVDIFNSIFQYLDYLKVGKFNASLGGLDSKLTNQRFYKINGMELEDNTNVFRKNHRKE